MTFECSCTRASVGARRIWAACADGPAHTCLVLEDDARFEKRELSLLVALFNGALCGGRGEVEGGMLYADAACRSAGDRIQGGTTVPGTNPTGIVLVGGPGTGGEGWEGTGGEGGAGGTPDAGASCRRMWDLLSLGVSALSSAKAGEDAALKKDPGKGLQGAEGKVAGAKGEKMGGGKDDEARGVASEEGTLTHQDIVVPVATQMHGEGAGGGGGEGGERGGEDEEEDDEEEWVDRVQWVRKPGVLLQKELSIRALREGDLGSHAYLLTRTGARKLLALPPNLPTDTLIVKATLEGKIKGLLVTPSLVAQEGLLSTTELPDEKDAPLSGV